ncbi:MAG TPA: hypothetical protein VN495_01155 [Candidatus Paceibacterota bacterium]|nr:hypothetical protein [Candidatus Paceibacterota bacterium]
MASPLGGRVPLLVTFSGEANGPYSIDFDDGSPGFSFTCGGAPCGSNAINQSHTYSADGIYKIDMNDTTGKYSQTVTVSTQNATGTAAGGCTSWNVQCQAGYQLQDNGVGSNGCQLQPTCTPTPPGYAPGFGPGGSNLAYTTTVYYDDTTGSATPPPSQTALNQKTPTLPPPGQGLHGDLLSAGGGATIQATSVNGNSAVSGFFGIAGNATNLCLSRPWANNFLSYIIPPSFFDNICSLAGYPVGVVQAPGGGQASTNVSVAPPQQQTTQYQTSSQAQAKIWANPASVSLGGRTTIFWTTQGVTSCVESSSDGNFSGNSTSGGASTVALSGPVTFTIKCNTPTGTPITNSATVTIGN